MRMLWHVPASIFSPLLFLLVFILIAKESCCFSNIYIVKRPISVRASHYPCSTSIKSSQDGNDFDISVSAPLDQPSLEPLLDAISRSTIVSSLSSTETFRVFHGRGGCYPGCEHLTLDWFPPVWVLTSFQVTLSEKELTTIGDTLASQWGNGLDDKDQQPLTWVYQCRQSSNNTVDTTVMAGTIPDPHIVTENGCQYFVQTTADPTRRHRGIFLDMANGRRWLQENARGKFVLNMFSYTCAFSVAALKGGAEEVVNIDMAKGAIKLGQQNHELNGLTTGARFLSHDIFKSWGKLRKLGPYDIIVVDPPSYQKGSFVAKNDYAKLIRRLPDLLVNTGSTSQVMLCLNAPELGVEYLKELVSDAAPQLHFLQRIENPTSFPSADSDRALKVLLFELRDSPVEED